MDSIRVNIGSFGEIFAVLIFVRGFLCGFNRFGIQNPVCSGFGYSSLSQENSDSCNEMPLEILCLVRDLQPICRCDAARKFSTGIFFSQMSYKGVFHLLIGHICSNQKGGCAQVTSGAQICTLVRLAGVARRLA